MEVVQVPAVRVKSSEDLLNKGEYVFIEKRPPQITIEKTPLTPPIGFLKLKWWNWFGKKYEMRVSTPNTPG